MTAVQDLTNIRCPGCGNKVLQKSDEQASLRPAGSVRFTKSGCEMTCHFCRRDLSLPLRLVKSEGRAEVQPRLTLKKS